MMPSSLGFLTKDALRSPFPHTWTVPHVADVQGYCSSQLDTMMTVILLFCKHVQYNYLLCTYVYNTYKFCSGGESPNINTTLMIFEALRLN